MALSWQFDKRSVDERKGWDDPGIAQFRENKIKSLVCEILQNSLDNPRVRGQDDPVIVEFKEVVKKRDEIPGIEELLRRLEYCRENSNKESSTSLEEIERAIQVAKSETIKCLVISDFNTSGLIGPDEADSYFHTYMKSDGSSGADPSRGGSHGHGKNSVLSMSDLRSIFVSTYWDNGGSIDHLFQGRATLMTHKMLDRIYDPKGYFGEDNFRAFRKLEEKFSWLDRPSDQTGTTITVLGWQSPKGWEERAIGYALAIYFPAALRGKLICKIGDRELSQKTVNTLFEDADLFQKFKKIDGALSESIEAAKLYARCLIGGSEDGVIAEEKQVLGDVGKSSIRMIVEEGYPKKVAILRNNMFITDTSDKNVAQYLYQRWPGSIKEFAGVFECLDTKGNKTLRGMEPSQHNTFSPDILSDTKKDSGVKALKSLGAALKDVIVKYARIETGDSLELEWSKDFFSDEAGDGSEADIAADINPNGIFEVTPKPRPLRTPKILSFDLENGESDDASGDEDENGVTGESAGGGRSGGDGAGGSNPGEGRGNKGGQDASAHKGRPIVAFGRAVRMDDEGESYRVTFRVKNKVVLNVGFIETGQDNDYSLSVSESDRGILQNGELVIEAGPGASPVLVKFDRPVVGGIKVLGYGDQ